MKSTDPKPSAVKKPRKAVPFVWGYDSFPTRAKTVRAMELFLRDHLCDADAGIVTHGKQTFYIAVKCALVK